MEIILIAVLVLSLIAMFVYVIKTTIDYERKLSIEKVYQESLSKDLEQMTKEWLKSESKLIESTNELALCRKRIEELEQQQAQPKQEALSLDDEIKKMYDMQDKEQKKQYDELMEAWHYNHKKKELKDEQ